MKNALSILHSSAPFQFWLIELLRVLYEQISLDSYQNVPVNLERSLGHQNASHFSYSLLPPPPSTFRMALPSSRSYNSLPLTSVPFHLPSFSHPSLLSHIEHFPSHYILSCFCAIPIVALYEKERYIQTAP